MSVEGGVGVELGGGGAGGARAARAARCELAGRRVRAACGGATVGLCAAARLEGPPICLLLCRLAISAAARAVL